MKSQRIYKLSISLVSAFLITATFFFPAFAKSDNSKAGNPPGLTKKESGDFSGNSLLLIPHGNKVKITEIDEEDDEQKSEDVEEFILESSEEENEATESGEPVRVKASNNAAMVIRNKLAAQTHFPLKVNLETNELIVTTPKGEKIVTVLPDKAVANMLAANVLDQLGGKGGLLWQLSQPTPTATTSATPTATVSATPSLISPTATPSGTSTPSASPTATITSEAEFPIQLVLTEDGVLAYQIDGAKFERLLGLIKVKLNRVVIVSAENGQLLEVNQNLPTRILDFLSF